MKTERNKTERGKAERNKAERGKTERGKTERDKDRYRNRSDAHARSNNLIYGRRTFVEVVDAGVELKSIYILKGVEFDKDVKRALGKLIKKDIQVKELDIKEMDRLTSSGKHQGIVAMLGDFKYADLDIVLNLAKDKQTSLIFVLDHIEDVGNFGAIVRSAEFMGATAIIIPNRRSIEVTPTAYKTSAGAIANLPIIMVSNIASACEQLKCEGFWVYGADADAKQTCFEIEFSKKAILVLGSEHSGISDLVKKRCDELVCLPRYGKTASLNVSAAATTLGYEYLRQVNYRTDG